MNARSSILTSSAVTASVLVAALVPGLVQAAEVSVDQDEVCVVSTHGDGTKGHYLLTQRIVTQLDEAGEPVPGSGKADPWKRWPRRDFRAKWTTYCG